MIAQIYELFKTDSHFSWMSDKEKMVYLQLSEIKDNNKSDSDLGQICHQRISFMRKFMTKLREEKLWPIPIKYERIPTKNETKSNNPYREKFNPPIQNPTIPHCENCGLEGTVETEGRQIIQGIILFKEWGRILCSTCRLKAINPIHGRETDEEGEEDS